MSARIVLACLVAAFAVCAARAEAESKAQKDEFAVAAYLPEWRYQGIDYDAVADHVTHLIFFSLEIDDKGDPSALDRFPDETVLEKARAARERTGMKLLICFGGNARSNGFPGIAVDKEKRKRFLKRLNGMMDRYGLDGVDYNWEYPRNEAEWRGWANLLKSTQKMFKPRGRIVTIAYYPDGRQEQVLAGVGGKDGSKMIDYVDLVHSMAYDSVPGEHSTYDFARKTVARWTSQDLPAKKLTLGVPFYARHTKTGDWKTYEELVKTLREKESDETAGFSDKVNTYNSYFFNNPQLIGKKTTYAHEKDIGGIMIWELGQDVHPSDDQSLLKAITSRIPEFRAAASGHTEL